MINATLRDLLDKIFVADPEQRITFDEMKEHNVFSDFDFSMKMRDRFKYGSAPFIPT